MVRFLYNMRKPTYIREIESKNDISYSVISLPVANNQFMKLADTKFELVYSVSNFEEDGKITFSEKVYTTKQNFYIYLLITDDDEVQVKVFYIQKQFDELRLVFGQILKQKNLWKLQQKN
jgi:hypothetical protein